MEMDLCFICNIHTDEGNKNLSEIRSQHTNTRITDLLQIILGDLTSNRTIEDEVNCACSDCLNRLDEYDWLCVLAKKQEQELRKILLHTESILEDKFGESNNDESSIDRKIDIVMPEIAEILYSSDEEYSPTQKQKLSKYQANIRSDHVEGNELQNTNDIQAASTIANTTYQRGAYTCLTCGQIFMKKKEFMDHERRHKQQQQLKYQIPFQCDICTFVLSNQESFDDHKKQHEHKSSPFECVICNLVLSSKFALKKHVRIHIGIPNYICDICGKAYIHHRSFETHMKYHNNDRQKKCPHCPMAFVQSSHLKTHLQTHRKDEPLPFECRICSKRFGYLYNMKVHEKLHTSTDKIHKCSLCDARFARHSKMIQHMEKQH